MGIAQEILRDREIKKIDTRLRVFNRQFYVRIKGVQIFMQVKQLRLRAVKDQDQIINVAAIPGNEMKIGVCWIKDKTVLQPRYKQA